MESLKSAQGYRLMYNGGTLASGPRNLVAVMVQFAIPRNKQAYLSCVILIEDTINP